MLTLRAHSLSDDLSSLKAEEVEIPPPSRGEARMRMRACALNFPDLLMLKGGYQFKPPFPFTPGMEWAGEILALGENVKRWQVGDAVIAGGLGGGLAQEMNLPAERLSPKPAPMSWEEAAAYRMAYLTAYVSLFRRGDLKKGETLLVHGAGGGVGLAAVEVGKIFGATVIACASSEEKRRAAKDKGADHALPAAGFRDEVKRLTDNRGADVIYDPVGGSVFDESVRAVAWGGRLLVVGFASGVIPTLPVNMPLIKGFSVVGVRAGEHGRKNPKMGAEDIAAIDSWAEKGRIKPFIGAKLPLKEARRALALMRDRELVGKAVLVNEG